MTFCVHFLEADLNIFLACFQHSKTTPARGLPLDTHSDHQKCFLSLKLDKSGHQYGLGAKPLYLPFDLASFAESCIQLVTNSR